MDTEILTLNDFDYQGKTVILRLDINSPIDRQTGQLADDNRIRKSLSTIRELAARGGRVVMLAHQGDTEDYHNLMDLSPHAARIAELLGHFVSFVDDIAGPAAIERMETLRNGELLLLNNVRYLVEEVSTFVNYVKLNPEELSKTRLVRNLAPHADLYVCEAFSAAHRSAPSLVGFAEVLPAAGGRLFVEELNTLTQVRERPEHPCVYVLGGARIADAFSMMQSILGNGSADKVLTSGLTGEVMLLACGQQLGAPSEKLIHNKGLDPYIGKAQDLLNAYADKILYPSDFAIIDEDQRREIGRDKLPVDTLLVDIGAKTIADYIEVINSARTIFVNGPAGIYEQPMCAEGTRRLWSAIADAPGYSVIGGGDSVAAARRFGVQERMGYVCTSGGGMVRFLSGQKLPVVEELKRAAARYRARRSE